LIILMAINSTDGRISFKNTRVFFF